MEKISFSFRSRQIAKFILSCYEIKFDEEPPYEYLKSILAVKEDIWLPKITNMVYSKIEMSNQIYIEEKVPVQIEKVSCV